MITWNKRANIEIRNDFKRSITMSKCGRYCVIHSVCTLGNGALSPRWYAMRLDPCLSIACVDPIEKPGTWGYRQTEIWTIISTHRLKGPAIKAVEDYDRRKAKARCSS